MKIEPPVTVAGVTVIPVAQVSLSYWHVNRGFSFFGVKQPASVVVVSRSVRKAFRVTGEEVSLDQLIQEVPGMRELLEKV